MRRDEFYRRWVEHRKALLPSDRFADQIMASVAEHNTIVRQHFLTRLLLTIGATRYGRWAVCSGALLIGMTPFVYAAFLAKLIVF